MLSNNENIITKLKKDTNNLSSIIYRKMIIKKHTINIIFNEPLTSSNKISDFIIRSLSLIHITNKNILNNIENSISNFKYTKIYNYESLCLYLHKGFTIILIENINIALALETKADLSRSITVPDTQNTIRGSKDSFVEEYQINLGLIKKRIKTNNLWTKDYLLGSSTSTITSIIYINGLANKKILSSIKKKLDNISVPSVISTDNIKKFLESKGPFPTIITSQRPDMVSNALLEGKIVIACDNSPFMLILPNLFTDYFKTSEDLYSRSLNTSLLKYLKYLCFFISIFLPSIYVSLITINHDIIPTELLINFATQRSGVPFPAFIEALIMIISFEVLKECDLRVPSFAGSALSIVGALILGEAAVNAGIVSPIMIIIIAATSVCSLPFTEPEFINSIRVHRILCMASSIILGFIGIVVFTIIFILRLSSVNPYYTNYIYNFTNPFKKENKWLN